MCTKIHHPFESPSRWICSLSLVRYMPLATPRGLWVMPNKSVFCTDYWAKSCLIAVFVYQNFSSLWKVLQGEFISSMSWGVGPLSCPEILCGLNDSESRFFLVYWSWVIFLSYYIYMGGSIMPPQVLASAGAINEFLCKTAVFECAIHCK